MRLTSKYTTAILTVGIIIAALIIQSYVLASLSFNWWHVDLITIISVFIAIEFSLFNALIYVLLAAFLMHGFSSISFGFYLMFYLDVLVISKLLVRQFSLANYFNRLWFFSGIMLLKFVLLYLLLYVGNKSYGTLDFIGFVFPELFVTIVLFIPIYSFLNTLYKKLSPMDFL